MNAKLLHVLFLLLGILSIGNQFGNIGNTASQIEISRNRIEAEKDSIQIVEILEKEDLVLATLAPSSNLKTKLKDFFFHSNFSINRLTFYFSALLFDFS